MLTPQSDETESETPARGGQAQAAARGGQAAPVHPAGPPAGGSQSPGERALEGQVVALFNQQRAAHGLAPLALDPKLAQSAQAHSDDMLLHQYFAHNDAQGSWDARIRRYVKRSEVGEILSFGSGEYATPAGMVTTWMGSPEHRKVILTPDLRRVGVGVATGTYDGEDGVAMATADFSSAA